MSWGYWVTNTSEQNSLQYDHAWVVTFWQPVHAIYKLHYSAVSISSDGGGSRSAAYLNITVLHWHFCDELFF